jgi:hypothetical protein
MLILISLGIALNPHPGRRPHPVQFIPEDADVDPLLDRQRICLEGIPAALEAV